MSRESLIEFRNATLGYGGRPVLAGVGLSIERGAFVGIFGPNGSGKTTILKTLLGLIPPLKGQLDFKGSRRPRYGYVPQKEKLDPIYPLSAYEVAAMGSCRKLELFQRLRGRDNSSLIRHSLKICGALELAPRPYSDLSGGQRQRVLIARALAAEPELLALDEPLAGIDITTQKALLKLLKQIKEEGNLTVLMVSHRIQIEKGLFSHIAWVDEGKAAMGPAEEMLTGGRFREVFKSEL